MKKKAEMISTLRLGHGLDALSLGAQSGPGLRIIVYLKGCSLFGSRCTARCLNPELVPARGGHVVRVDDLAERLRWLAEDVPEANHLTVLGGEPLDQAPALAELLARFREGGGSTMVYTGRVFEQIVAQGTPAERAVLGLTDLLVDGPFVEALHDEALVWRGSHNQRIVRLSARFTEADVEAAIASQARGCSITTTPSAARVTAGPQTLVAAAALARRPDRQRAP